jgi:ABC-2 type transport system ATP-binding protein
VWGSDRGCPIGSAPKPSSSARSTCCRDRLAQPSERGSERFAVGTIGRDLVQRLAELVVQRIAGAARGCRVQLARDAFRAPDDVGCRVRIHPARLPVRWSTDTGAADERRHVGRVPGERGGDVPVHRIGIGLELPERQLVAERSAVVCLRQVIDVGDDGRTPAHERDAGRRVVRRERHVDTVEAPTGPDDGRRRGAGAHRFGEGTVIRRARRGCRRDGWHRGALRRLDARTEHRGRDGGDGNGGRGRGHRGRVPGVRTTETSHRTVATHRRRFGRLVARNLRPVSSAPLDARPGDAPPAIVANGLTKAFDAEPVVRDVDLKLARGSILGLIGPSGCGKTTTVRLLTGLLRPTAGTAYISGTEATRLTPAQRQRIGYLPQIPALFDDLSLVENLNFHASMYGLPLRRRRRRLRALLDWVELLPDRRKRVRDVSGGMQRRLALASTFVHDPQYAFLDEPTAGIDPILRDKFWQEFRTMRDQGRTLLVTTQYVGEAAHCDLVGLLSDGELLMVDSPENLRRAAFGGEVVDLVLQRPPTDADVADLERLPVVVGSVERLDPVSLRIVVDDAMRALDVLRQRTASGGLSIVEANEHIVDYDEAFVRVVERHRRHLTPAGGDEARRG